MILVLRLRVELDSGRVGALCLLFGVGKVTRLPTHNDRWIWS